MVSWFRDAGLDVGLLPPAASALDAFHFAAGQTRTYATGGVEYVMTSTVALDDERRIVRDVAVTYTLGGRERRTKLAELVYVRPTKRSAANVWGSQRWEHRISAVTAPPGSEHRAQVDAFVEAFSAAYTAHDRAVPVDAIRRAFYLLLTACDAFLVRHAGGVYFIAHRYLAVAQGMRAVTEQVGPPSHFALIPVPDTREQRATIDLALVADVERACRRVRDEAEALAVLDRLARHQRSVPASDVSAAAEVVERLLGATKSD